jgi:hypothetical protein
MKLEERTIQSKLRYWAKQTRTAAVIAGPPADILDEAADRLDQAQSLAEERLVSIGHWKAANEEAQRERDEALRAVLELYDESDELKARLADRERELSLLQQAVMGATAGELTVNACQTDLKTDEDLAALGEIVRAGRERLIPPAERGFGVVPKPPPPGPPAPPEPKNWKPVA